MTIDQIISIIGHLGTWIIAICVLLQLREMAKQRRGTYKPELVITKKSVYGLFRNDFGILIPDDWRDEEHKDDDFTTINFYLTLHNLGFAAATDIRLNWNFDITLLVNKINEYILNKSIELELSNKNKYTCVKSKQKAEYLLPGHLTDSHDYLLSSEIDRNGIPIILPRMFILLTALDYYVYMHEQKSLQGDSLLLMPESPFIDLLLEYKDIEGKAYKKIFRGRINYNILTYPYDNLVGKVGFIGYFEFVQQK